MAKKPMKKGNPFAGKETMKEERMEGKGNPFAKKGKKGGKGKKC